jgi:hypothetical protein
MQEEMERVFRLFEFLENVLPQEPAAAMRFFNRSQGVGEVRKDCTAMATDTRSLGLDVEMERYKVHVEEEVRKSQASMHQEVTNCMLAIKGLQRDVDITRGALLAQRPLLHEAPSAKRSSSPPSPLGTIEEGTGGTRNDESPSTLVSRSHVHDEITGLRDEVKSWLDHLSESIQRSIREKVEHAMVGAEAVNQRRQLAAKAQPRAAFEAPTLSFDPSRAICNNWRPSSSPGTKQLRAPGATTCGPGGSRSLPKFPTSPAEAIRPFGQDTVKPVRQR